MQAAPLQETRSCVTKCYYCCPCVFWTFCLWNQKKIECVSDITPSWGNAYPETHPFSLTCQFIPKFQVFYSFNSFYPLSPVVITDRLRLDWIGSISQQRLSDRWIRRAVLHQIVHVGLRIKLFLLYYFIVKLTKGALIKYLYPNHYIDVKEMCTIILSKVDNSEACERVLSSADHGHQWRKPNEWCLADECLLIKLSQHQSWCSGRGCIDD